MQINTDKKKEKSVGQETRKEEKSHKKERKRKVRCLDTSLVRVDTLVLLLKFLRDYTE